MATACHRPYVTAGGMMPILPRKAPRRRPTPVRALLTVAVVAAQALIAMMLLALVVGPAEGSPQVTPPGGAKASARRPLAAPRQLSPSPRAAVKAVPAFSWAPVRGAIKYEFQLAADPAFESIVQGQRRGSFQTANTFATIDKTLADGEYYWRVRAIDKRERAGRWSRARSLSKVWATPPALQGPVDGANVTYPRDSLVLRWAPVPRAYKYLVQIATDPSLAHSALGDRTPSVETSGLAFSLPAALAQGRYYWAVTPLDGDKHPGARSAVSSFTWNWPSKLDEQSQLGVNDLDDSAEVFDPQLTWTPIPGAAQYEVEISTALSRDGGGAKSFPAGSVVCCADPVTGTSLSPPKVLANNTGSGQPGDPEQFGYWWRVRGVDPDGNAGEWNYGQPFDKTFPAAIAGLHLRDNLGDVPTDADPSTAVVDTSAPAIVWDQVPGASSYEVQVVPYVQIPNTSLAVCNWSASSDTWDVVTAATAWTPLGSPGTHKPSGVLTNLSPARDGAQPNPGTAYCARVKARRDRDAKGKEVVSDWTTMGGGTQPAFRFVAPPAPSGSTLALTGSDYVQPANAAQHPWMPLFTWKPVDGARGYFVVVARDEQFTKIVDLAFTNVPAYAPRRNREPWTYPDETTSYWWAVVPTALSNGDIAPTPPSGNAPRRFLKQSTPPEPISPAGGETISRQPTFRWRPTLGARSYTLEVAQDPSFGDPIASITTDSSGYTTSATLPADTALYWRVRANDEIGTGLNWSRTERFRRSLPAPVPDANNPLGGETIPVLSWSPVEGAVAYDMHVEQADGTKRNFTFRSTAFTPVVFYGTGVWHWQVRASFKFGSTVVSSGYSGALPYTRRIATPTGVRTTKVGTRALLSWDPAGMARQYKVQIATTDSFSRMVEQATTSNTSYAPKMTSPLFRSHKRLYWRVAVVDEGLNVGGWTTSALSKTRPMRLRLRGSLHRGRARVVRATVKDAHKRAISGARVSVTGAGLHVQTRHTSRRGTVSFRLRPRMKGKVRFQAEKRGFTPTAATIRVA
jgi:hypothetical protein